MRKGDGQVAIRTNLEITVTFGKSRRSAVVHAAGVFYRPLVAGTTTIDDRAILRSTAPDYLLPITMLRLSWISAVSFIAAFLLSSMLVDHGLVEGRFRGPGLTTDETLNIPQGVYLVEALAEQARIRRGGAAR